MPHTLNSPYGISPTTCHVLRPTGFCRHFDEDNEVYIIFDGLLWDSKALGLCLTNITSLQELDAVLLRVQALNRDDIVRHGIDKPPNYLQSPEVPSQQVLIKKILRLALLRKIRNKY